ncbi:MAG: hypothetical protein K2K17_07690 [Lachnospiraceae bacterium]|nr:hypothetical protein [Lachnospiraceae bacterium]
MKKIYLSKPCKYFLKFLGIFLGIVILLYSTITLILFCIRGDRFGGYYIRQENGNQVLCYRDNYYIMVRDPKEIEEIYRLGIEGEGAWILVEDVLVAYSPIKFPFIEYWWPDIFLNQVIWLQHSEYSGEYLMVATLGGEIFYKKQ